MGTVTTTEARNQLSRCLAAFREQGVNAEPLVFGDHRRNEAVVLPWVLYQQVRQELAQARFLANTKLQDEIAAVHRDPSLAVKVQRRSRAEP